MENSATEVITLDQVEVRNLPELQGWREKQQQIVKEHPFIAIEDHKTYEEAKKHRTALVSARTDIQKQDKLIASKLKELRNEAGKVAEELISITQPHEEKQQEEVKRYEAEREAKRLEEERLEQERKAAIQKSVNEFYNDWKQDIAGAEFNQLENLQTSLLSSIETESKKDFEEFELDFAEKVNLLKDQLKERAQYLKEKEEARLEAERLAAERAAFEREQAEARAKAEKEEAERKAREEKERAQKELHNERLRIIGPINHFGKPIDLDNLAEFSKEEFKTIVEIKCDLRKQKELAEKEREAEELARKKAEEEKLRKEYAAIEAEKNRLAEEERKRQEAIEAERKAKEEAEAKAKAEAEEKARKEAEAKRLKALQPDKEILKEWILSLDFTDDCEELKDSAAIEVHAQLFQSHEDWKASAIERIQNLK